jgi:DNA-binding IclR family transcriptional regulator
MAVSWFSSWVSVTGFQLAADQSRVMPRLVREGLVATTPDGRYYLGDPERIARSNRVSIAMAVGATIPVTAAVIGLFWLATKQ